MTSLVLLSNLLDTASLLPSSISKYREDATICYCRFRFMSNPYENCMAVFIVSLMHSS